MIGSTKLTLNVCLMRYVSFPLSKKLPQHRNTVMFKYGIFGFLYLYQVVTSLAITGILFQNNVNIFNLLRVILISMFDINEMILIKCFLFHLKSSFRSWDIQIFGIFSHFSVIFRPKRTNGRGIIGDIMNWLA